MKQYRIHIPLTAALILVAAGITTVVTRSSRGQTPSSPQKTESLAKPTIIIEPSIAGRTSSPFADAAAHNALLRNELEWSFGSKQQHGWYLYDSLIGQTFKIGFDSSSSGFAGAIADWHKQKNLRSTGVLDENSWMALVAQWQANRLKDKTPATPDQLLMAPAAEWLFPEREPENRMVEKN